MQNDQIKLLFKTQVGIDEISLTQTLPPRIISAPDWSKPFEIMYDASDFVVGVVLR